MCLFVYDRNLLALNFFNLNTVVLKKIFVIPVLLFALAAHAQQTEKTFTAAFKSFTEDPSFKHATISLLMINNTTGKTVTDLHSEVGVAPASCQKVLTAATALSLLGEEYTYQTTLVRTGTLSNGVLNGDIIIKGSGDPTLGSWRYAQTGEETVIAALKEAILREGINEITGHIYADESLWNSEATPDGWPWQDIGNYYGAGARALNWRENQYDLYLRSGSHIGDPVSVAGTKPAFVEGLHLISEVTSGPKGSGDNNYVYLPLNDEYAYVRGTTPVNEEKFTISGAMPHPARQLAITLEAAIKNQAPEAIAGTYPRVYHPGPAKVFYTYSSPVMDSVIFHFLRRSINLYGESLLKTLAFRFTGKGVTDSGVNVVQRFWKDKGIEPYAINIYDGSGLSPTNRVTARALVTVMQYAKKQKWFPAFYDALPTISGIKMKSGSITGVISYTGYIKGKDGADYTFSFLVNNYDGSGNAVRQKMWKLLGIL